MMDYTLVKLWPVIKPIIYSVWLPTLIILWSTYLHLLDFWHHPTKLEQVIWLNYGQCPSQNLREPCFFEKKHLFAQVHYLARHFIWTFTQQTITLSESFISVQTALWPDNSQFSSLNQIWMAAQLITVAS